MQQAFEGGAWHGPPVSEIVAGISPGLAATRPGHGLHSIWAIVLHLIATQGLLLRRLDGDADAAQLPPAEDWPAVDDTSPDAWQSALDRLAANDRELRRRIAAYSAEQLDQPLVPGGSSAYNNFHGYVQHNLYHAAQIGLLRKLLS
jgi:uncharacterized damage-inducible protein DinB